MFKLHYEVWKPVVGYEGLYEVSNYCKVRALNYKGRYGRHLIWQKPNKKGYIQIVLWKDGKPKSTHSHHIGAEAFIPNPNHYPVVNHKDENPSNNYICLKWDGSVDYEKTNLEWASYSYNLKYKGALERMIETRNKKGCYGAQKPVLQLSLDGDFISKYKSAAEAAVSLGYSEGFISMVCNGKRKCNKYIFKYA